MVAQWISLNANPLCAPIPPSYLLWCFPVKYSTLVLKWKISDASRIVCYMLIYSEHKFLNCWLQTRYIIATHARQMFLMGWTREGRYCHSKLKAINLPVSSWVCGSCFLFILALFLKLLDWSPSQTSPCCILIHQRMPEDSSQAPIAPVFDRISINLDHMCTWQWNIHEFRQQCVKIQNCKILSQFRKFHCGCLFIQKWTQYGWYGCTTRCMWDYLKLFFLFIYSNSLIKRTKIEALLRFVICLLILGLVRLICFLVKSTFNLFYSLSFWI